MYRYFLLIMLLFTSVALKAEGMPPSLAIMNYNVYMLDHHTDIFIGGTNPNKRAQLLADSSVFDNTDVIVFNEVFDNQASDILIEGLSGQFPYRTPVLGRDKNGWDRTEGWNAAKLDDGGVILLSRFPIEYKAQVIFGEGCGADKLSQKGFLHAVIEKGGEHYNVIGTHVQADDSSCKTPPSVVRNSQFSQINRYISEVDRSFDEMFFISGDLNVVKETEEFSSMLEVLNVSEPTNYSGAKYSWDPGINGLAHANYPDLKGQLLDYVLVERSHKQPKNWHNQVLDVLSKRVELPGTQEPYYFYEYSDHFPVIAFEYADGNTQTHSFRPNNKPYNSIKLQHQMTGQFVIDDPNSPNGWLTYSKNGENENALFKLDNWHPYDGICIHDHDYVQISRADSYKDYYWNYSGSSYYTKDGNASDFMKISRKSESEGCIKNGDVVYLYDHAHTLWSSPEQYIEPVNSFIKGERKLPVGDNGLFIIQMSEPNYDQWKDKLIYK